jgi:hypothetical protein
MLASRNINRVKLNGVSEVEGYNESEISQV